MRSTYYGRAQSYSRSYNAELAELDGRLPLTRFCAKYGLRPSLVRLRGSNEWHHVGKYATPIDYYDWRDFVGQWHSYSKLAPSELQLRCRESIDMLGKAEQSEADDISDWEERASINQWIALNFGKTQEIKRLIRMAPKNQYPPLAQITTDLQVSEDYVDHLYYGKGESVFNDWPQQDLEVETNASTITHRE